MARCRYCQRYHDPSEWPVQYRQFYTPDCCFKCYEEDPSRSEWMHQEEDASEDDEDTPPEPYDVDVDDVETSEEPESVDEG